MGRIQLKEIERVKKISKDDFYNNYVKKQRPVVIENLTEDWPAFTKWNLNYIKNIAGEKTVPLYDDRPVSHKDGFNEAHAKMKMSEYIDLLQSKPTNYRIFLYNLINEVPQLQNDFKWPKIGLRLVKQLPMLFFGGENSKVFMHFDIDYSNILHFHFHGEKQCLLFAPDQTPFMYKVPYSLISREDIDFDNQNNLWVGYFQECSNAGLQNFTNCTSYFSTNSGLPENNIFSLKIDNSNNIWIGTVSVGAFCFDINKNTLTDLKTKINNFPKLYCRYFPR